MIFVGGFKLPGFFLPKNATFHRKKPARHGFMKRRSPKPYDVCVRLRRFPRRDGSKALGEGVVVETCPLHFC